MVRSFLVTNLWILLIFHSAFAEESETDPQESLRLRYWEPVSSLVSDPLEYRNRIAEELNTAIDYTHQQVGLSFVNSATWFDQLFNNSEDFSLHNYSYIGLRTGLLWAQSEGIEPLFRIRAKVDLPYFNKKFKLVINSAKDQIFSEELYGTEDSLRAQNSTNNNSYTLSTALRWTILQARHYQLDIDTGIKATLPVKIFAKTHYEHIIPINTVWDFCFREQLFAVLNDESGTTTTFDFSRKININRLFRISQRFHFTDESEGLELSHGYTYYQLLNHGRALSYSASVSGHTDPNFEHTDFGLGIQYRQPFLRKWIQLFIEPELHYPRSENWKAQHQISFGLESLFGNPKT
jgi:hypothetical protein